MAAYIGVLYCMCDDVVMFVTISTVEENVYSERSETLSIDQQVYWKHGIKFARWQHRALGARRGLLCHSM